VPYRVSGGLSGLSDAVSRVSPSERERDREADLLPYGSCEAHEPKPANRAWSQPSWGSGALQSIGGTCSDPSGSIAPGMPFSGYPVFLRSPRGRPVKTDRSSRRLPCPSRAFTPRLPAMPPSGVAPFERAEDRSKPQHE
jgi:hypothetical protein